MSKELMYTLIARMHLKLNKLIEDSNYNLMNDEVIRYSQRLDRAISRYNKSIAGSESLNCRCNPYCDDNDCAAK